MKLKLLVFTSLLFFPVFANACGTDVTAVKSEFGGSDAIHTFHVTKVNAGAATVTFDATTKYLSNNHVYSRTSSYSVEISGDETDVEKTQTVEREIDEVVSVKVENVRCTP